MDQQGAPLKRPAFQFYTGDWQSNIKLRRATKAEKGIWIDVLCLLHASDEAYGVLRWSLRELAAAVGCKLSDLQSLRDKRIMKGADVGEQCEGYAFAPRHAGKVGEPVTLIEQQPGPIWYSSRMVRDEYIRTKRGVTTRFGSEPNATPINSPKDAIGDGSTTSTSSSTSVKQGQKRTRVPRLPAEGFSEFWAHYPKKVGRQEAEKQWEILNPDADLRITIMAALEEQKLRWTDLKFVKDPERWIKKRRWEDQVPRETTQQDRAAQQWLDGKDPVAEANRRAADEFVAGGSWHPGQEIVHPE